jgi:hypothetical protein
MAVIMFLLELVGTFFVFFVIATGLMCLGIVVSGILTYLFNLIFSKETWTKFIKHDK